MALMTAALVGGLMGLDWKAIPAKTEKKCQLKDCTKMTTHNHGFCCAEHCKKYRDLNKNK